MKKIWIVFLAVLLLVAGCVTLTKRDTQTPGVTYTKTEANGDSQTGFLPTLIDEEILLDKCLLDEECVDEDPCTLDSCSGVPKMCSNAPITECTSDDACCPVDCTHQTDNDCEVTDECQSNIECNDDDSTTNDVCSGTPKKCSQIKKWCTQMSGQICEENQNCSEEVVVAADSEECCLKICED